MSSIKTAAVLIVLLLVIVGSIALWSERPMIVSPPIRRAASKSAKSSFGGPKKTVLLYFLVKGHNILQEEPREIVGGATTTEDAKRILAEILKGPESDLMPTIPRAAQLRNLFIDPSGTVYVDFDRQLKEGLRGGGQEERYAVFSIVDSLVSNLAQIKRVQILVEGVEIPTLTGSVDTMTPLSPQYVF
jgi:hypothetical protein